MSTQTDTVRYELMVIISPDIGENAIKKRLDALRKSLTDFGGEIFFEDIWGLRNLAYQIKKHDQGYYVVLDVNLDPQHVKELDRMLRLEVEVLRHLLIKLPAVYQPKSLTEMEAEVQEQMPEEQKEEKKERKEKPVPVKKAETPKETEKEEKPAKTEKKETKSAEETPKKAPKKKEEDKKALEDIDAKLDSILSNPDINF